MTTAFDPASVKDVADALNDGVATVALNRPQEGDAMTRVVHDDLDAVWREVKDDPDVRVVILTGR